VNLEAVQQLHGLRQQPGGGQQAGPDSLPTPSQRPFPTGRLVVAEALPSRRRPPRAPRAALLAALLVSAAACSRTAQPAAFERPPAPVRVAPAESRDVPVYLDEIGHAAAVETVWIRAQVGGRIDAVNFEDGAELRKGDVLVTLDARPFQAKLDAAEASLSRARAMHERAQSALLRPEAALTRARAVHELAQSELARTEKLVASNAASQSDYDVRKNAVAVTAADVSQAEADLRQAEPDERQAQAEVKQAEAAVTAARLDLEYATIRSPIDGRAGRRLVDAGNVIEANGDPLVMLERLDPAYVEFTVPEVRLGEVQRNMAKGKLRVEVRLPGETGDPLAGELTFVDNAVEQGTGTVKMRATLANGERRLWPGRFVDVRLVLETISRAVVVPAAATQMSGKGPFVYVVKDDETADLRPVQLGQRQGEMVVVESGVKPGERVVVSGQIAVMPGGKVRVAAPAESAGAPGAKSSSGL
jgi:membrane fusion protein, multidrug efflux system